MPAPDPRIKYQFYENSVQAPAQHADWLAWAYTHVHPRKKPQILREDFCGIFRICCEWVQAGSQRKALGVELSDEPLNYGREENLSSLPTSARRRIRLIQSDVRKTPSGSDHQADIVFAGNYSFFVFKKEEELLRYFRNVERSLRQNGILVMEVPGGPGMMEIGEEKRVIRRPGRRSPWFTYIWEQRRFDPLNHDLECAIHFRRPNGKHIWNAFVYDWRLWTLPELRYWLQKAGFSQVHVFWEKHHPEGDLSGEYELAEKGVNDYSWISYLAAIK